MYRWIAMGAGVLAVVVLAWVLRGSQGVAHEEVAEAMDRNTRAIERLERRVEALEHRPAGDDRPSQTPSGGSRAEALDSRVLVAPTGAAPEMGSGHDTSQTPEQLALALDSAFAGEPPDPAGEEAALAMESLTLAPALVSHGLVPADLSSECRARSCLVVAHFDEAVTADDWAMLFLASAGEWVATTRVVRIPGADGSVELRLYSTRQPD